MIDHDQIFNCLKEQKKHFTFALMQAAEQGLVWIVTA